MLIRLYVELWNNETKMEEILNFIIIQPKCLAISIVMMMLRIIYEKNRTTTRPKGRWITKEDKKKVFII